MSRRSVMSWPGPTIASSTGSTHPVRGPSRASRCWARHGKQGSFMSRITPAAATEPIVHASGASRAMLQDGRWHFQHGPIDLIIGAQGDPDDIRLALSGAWDRFTQILPELV